MIISSTLAARAPLVWTRPLHLLLKVAELLRRALATRARLLRVLPAQVALGVTHLFGDFPQLLLFSRRAGPALTALAWRAAARLAWLARSAPRRWRLGRAALIRRLRLLL